MTITLSKTHLVLASLIALTLLTGGFLLWLQYHDEQVRLASVVSGNAPAIKQAQQDVAEALKQIRSVNDKADKAQSAIDQKFQGLDSLAKQMTVLAQVMGMKQPPVIVQPGQVPQLPQGGAVLTPQQVQNQTDYAHACETCKVENSRLAKNLASTQGIVTARETENAKLKQDLQAAQRAARMGFKYKLIECGKRTLVTTVAGGTTAAVVQGVPGGKKDIGRGFEVGAAVGALSCVLLKP